MIANYLRGASSKLAALTAPFLQCAGREDRDPVAYGNTVKNPDYLQKSDPDRTQLRQCNRNYQTTVSLDGSAGNCAFAANGSGAAQVADALAGADVSGIAQSLGIVPSDGGLVESLSTLFGWRNLVGAANIGLR